MAMPAKRTITHGIMTDGTPVDFVLHGDENFHYYTTTEGVLLRRVGDAFEYADVAADGRLMAAKAPVAARTRAKALSDAAAPRRVPGLIEGTTFPAQGKQKVLVVLVEYQDIKFNLPNPLDYFTRMLNEPGFADYRATGSARDWFLHSSYGLFEPEFDVYGPVTLQKNREYYGGNDAWDQDSAPQKMAIEACRQLNADVDFTQYDRDSDGYIDNVFVVYAGRGEASGGPAESVWPHAWTLNGAEPGQTYTFDGVRLNRYACSNEWELSDQGYGYRPVGIGSFVHEFSHVMGLPDLYSTKYVEGSFTPGAWSAMDYGPYNNDLCTPPQFSAWERASLGWLEPKNLVSVAANVAMGTLEEGDAYILPTEEENEFYVIENRRQKGWDEFIPGHGMLAWHIDFDAEVWRTNVVNNLNSHNYVDIIEADGICTEASRDGDCFPGTAGITTFSPKAWDGKALPYVLTDIAELDGRVLMRVNGGQPDIDTPRLLEPTDIGPATITLHWMPVEGALGYRITFNATSYYTKGGDTGSYLITGLEPSTTYTYAISADDGAYGSPYTPDTEITTAEPTFDYFSPLALEATELDPDAFTANWMPLAGASEYFVDVLHTTYGAPQIISEGFDNGIDALRDGWVSSSKASYGMASYSGTATPSLRMSVDGDNLVIVEPAHIRAISLWHRGNGTTAAERLVLETPDGDGWVAITSFPIETEKGGTALASPVPDGTNNVRLRFSRPDKGAVAIDDIHLATSELVDETLHTALNASSATSLRITGLQAENTYKYIVYARDAEGMLSRASQPMTVRTPAKSGITATWAPADITVVGLDVYAPGTLNVYSICGTLVASGSGHITLPAPGIYIAAVPGFKPLKIIAKQQ